MTGTPSSSNPVHIIGAGLAGLVAARRLTERGVAFVEVALSAGPGNVAGWDTHADNFNQVKALSAVLDPAWASLMKDLRVDPAAMTITGRTARIGNAAAATINAMNVGMR